jgi:ribonuclease T1
VSWLAAAVLAVALSSEIPLDKLPPEARHTVALIKAGGPFPYQRDGSVFHNRESLLPKRSRGYYREYTVNTPGAKDRGARRIVAGQGGEFYYTEDHYRSFRRIIE